MTNTTTTEDQSRAGQVTESAKEVAGTAREQAGAVTSTAKDEAASVMHDARTQGRRLADQSRHQLRQTADEQGQRLAATLRDLGSQLHGMAAGTTAPKGMLADFTEQAASSARQLAGSLDDRGVQGVIDDVKRYARRRPGVFIAGAVAAGIVTGRLIRSLDTGAVMDAAKPRTEPGQDSDADPTPLPNGPMGTAGLNRPKEF
jgi:hypothetical protein